MDKKQILVDAEKRVKAHCENDATGHDFSHIDRVRRNAVKIAKTEGGDVFVIELAALLHDVEDWKTENAGSGMVPKWLEDVGADKTTSEKINNIISKISFKGVNHDDKMDSIEGKIVQDADRLDAIGAIGVVRCFAYGAAHGVPVYDQKIKPNTNISAEAFKKSPSINHFYEKLLLLKDRMNTETAKKMAEKRHKFMELFLKEFFEEWNT